MLVSTVLVTVIVVAGVVAWRAVDGGESTSEIGTGSWSHVALVNTATGTVAVVDDNGELADTTEPLGRARHVEASGDRLALVGFDSIVLTNGRSNDDPVIVPIERGTAVGRLAVDGSFLLTVGRPEGGDVVIVDAVDADTFDFGELTGQTSPLMFVETIRHDLAGTHVAIADAANFQTVAIDLANPAPVYFPDVPVAVGDEMLATSQVVGQRADIGLFDLAGSSLNSLPTEVPVGGVVDGDRLVAVSSTGTIFEITSDDDEPTRLGALAVPSGTTVTRVQTAMLGERLVVNGGVFQAVVDLDGNTVFTTTFPSAIEAEPVQPGWRCLPVGGGSSYHSLISLDTGEQLAELTGFALEGASSDGCSLVGTRAGVTELVTQSGTIALGETRSAVIAPDGRAVVVTTPTGATQLLTLDDEIELAEPIDLTEHAPSALAIAFLDR